MFFRSSGRPKRLPLWHRDYVTPSVPIGCLMRSWIVYHCEDDFAISLAVVVTFGCFAPAKRRNGRLSLGKCTSHSHLQMSWLPCPPKKNQSELAQFSYSPICSFKYLFRRQDQLNKLYCLNSLVSCCTFDSSYLRRTFRKKWFESVHAFVTSKSTSSTLKSKIGHVVANEGKNADCFNEKYGSNIFQHKYT